MRMLVAQELQPMRREIDDDQPAAGAQKARCLADRKRGIVEIEGRPALAPAITPPSCPKIPPSPCSRLLTSVSRPRRLAEAGMVNLNEIGPADMRTIHRS